ncbi:MAG: hypothetical protein M3277_10015 [Actinomycetota bacterium]|nr:hypothetical protein [Actinomycetota bacterium]
MKRNLPSGTVTLLFTDVEGSTKLLHELGPDDYTKALAEHRRILRAAFTRHGGVEVDTQGDAFFYAFPDASGAVRAAGEGRDSLVTGPIRVRIGIHTGTPHLTRQGYIGPDVHKGARIGAAGHGGQVLVSKETRDLIDLDVLDLGEHRLKDFAEPVWIYQLGAERFPPLKTISNTNLPRPASSFVGREQERDEVIALLRHGARLVTLSGPGGTGKTRLSIEAAAELVGEFPNGVFWVELATLRDPALVSATIGQTIGAKNGLADHIGEREMMLLLDNFEQIVDAAPELSAVLKECPNLRVLVTSRELLRIDGEVDYPVPPLDQRDAVELFCARSGLESDDAIAELCARLDNLPLAVELAAARASVLTPQQILERLASRLDLFKGGRDADPRQATLRATIEWSHDLLSDAEKTLFARLSVFRGGCTLESAEAVVDTDIDTLQSLVDKSLVRHTEGRLWMLETILEFATECLERSGQADGSLRAHAAHFLALAEEAEPHLREGGSKAWLHRLQREHDNVRAGLDRLAALGETQPALALAGAFWRFWYMRGHIAEGRRRLEGLLEADDADTPARAAALDGAAVMALNAGDVGWTKLRAEEALDLHRRFGDAWGAAYSSFMLANAVAEEKNFRRAQQLHANSVRLFRELGDEYYAQVSTDNLAWVCQELGEFERARSLREENLERARAMGNETVEALSLMGLGSLALDQDRSNDAIMLLTESLQMWRDAGDLLMLGRNLRTMADAFVRVGEAECAARLLARGALLFEEAGGQGRWFTDLVEEIANSLQDRLGDRAFAQAWEQGRALTIDEAVALAVETLKTKEGASSEAPSYGA